MQWSSFFRQNWRLRTCSYTKNILLYKYFPRFLPRFLVADYDLRKPKILSVSNGNLIVLKWQNMHVFSNLKYTAIYNKTWLSSLLYIQQRRIQNPFKRVIQEVTSLEVTNFAKSSILDVWESSDYAIAQWTIKTIKPHKAKTHNTTTLRQGT